METASRSRTLNDLSCCGLVTCRLIRDDDDDDDDGDVMRVFHLLNLVQRSGRSKRRKRDAFCRSQIFKLDTRVRRFGHFFASADLDDDTGYRTRTSASSRHVFDTHSEPTGVLAVFLAKKVTNRIGMDVRLGFPRRLGPPFPLDFEFAIPSLIHAWGCVSIFDVLATLTNANTFNFLNKVPLFVLVSIRALQRVFVVIFATNPFLLILRVDLDAVASLEQCFLLVLFVLREF